MSARPLTDFMKPLLCLTALLVASLTAAAQAKKAEIVSIKQIEFKGDVKPGSNIVAIVSVQVEKGYYLNSNRPTSPQMVRTDVQVSSTPAVKALPVSLSSAVPKTIQGVKDPVPVYEDAFTVNVPLAIAPNAVLPATLPAVLYYQATQNNVRQRPAQLRFNIVLAKPAASPPAK